MQYLFVDQMSFLPDFVSTPKPVKPMLNWLIRLCCFRLCVDVDGSKVKAGPRRGVDDDDDGENVLEKKVELF